MDKTEFERTPKRAQEELEAFVSPDHLAHLKAGRASVAEAVEMIREAIDEAEATFERGGEDALVQWNKENHGQAQNIASWYVNASSKAAYWGIPAKEFLREGEGQGEERVPLSEPPPDYLTRPPVNVPLAPERWRPFINVRATVFLSWHGFSNEEPLWPNLPRFPVAPPLLMLTNGWQEPPIEERARRIAEELTAPGAEGRLQFRLRKYVKDGPNLPRELVAAVGLRLDVEKLTTMRDILIRSGFKLPRDLTFVLKTKPPRR